SRELLEKEVINRFIPRVIPRMAAQARGEVVEKWAGRLIPVASSLIGAGLNYYFVRTWGRRAAAHFRQRHQDLADPMLSFRCSAILFDLDGVLLDSTRVVAEQYARWAREHGLDPGEV